MTTEAVLLADIYGLLLDDIRRNRAARLATQQQNGSATILTDDINQAAIPTLLPVKDATVSDIKNK